MESYTEREVFPKKIEEYGYEFNENGELRNIKTKERFLFVVKPEDRSYNQRHYEALGEVIGVYIEEQLVKRFNLIKEPIPVEPDENGFPKSRIYLSEDALNCQTLLLLIQGSGVVRPGQWARQVIINDSLEHGSMFPYIKKAQELNWGIIIFNPNENYGRINKDGIECGFREINGSESPQNHCIYVWERFVRKAKAKRILLVAHSFGGICTTAMMDHLADEFKSRVKGIALTDSVHSSGMVPKHSDRWFRGCTVNWIKSSLPLNDPVPEEASRFYGCRCTSAGHSKHEYTSGAAIEPVFEFLKGRLDKAIYDETRKSVSNNESEKAAEKSYEVTLNIEPSKVPHETNKGDEQSVANNEGDVMEMSNESPETGVNTKTQEQPSQVTHEKGNTVIINEKDESVANNESKEMEVADESLETGMNIQTQESGQVSLEQGTEAITNREDNQSSGANYKDEKDEMNTVETVTSTQQHHESSQMPPEEVTTAIPGGDETMEIDESSESVKNAPKEDAEMIIDAELNKDSGEYKKENNTSENQLVTPKGLPKEMSTDSTDVQHSKDEIIQDNNNKENTDNSLTSDQKNKVKQESDYKI